MGTSPEDSKFFRKRPMLSQTSLLQRFESPQGVAGTDLGADRGRGSASCWPPPPCALRAQTPSHGFPPRLPGPPRCDSPRYPGASARGRPPPPPAPQALQPPPRPSTPYRRVVASTTAGATASRVVTTMLSGCTCRRRRKWTDR